VSVSDIIKSSQEVGEGMMNNEEQGSSEEDLQIDMSYS